jgi:hypothetical protein
MTFVDLISARWRTWFGDGPNKMRGEGLALSGLSAGRRAHLFKRTYAIKDPLGWTIDIPETVADDFA